MPKHSKGQSNSDLRHGDVDTASSAIDLSDLTAALIRSLLDAKRRLDEEVVTLANQYRANPILRFLPPPAFSIGEVRVVIKFAIAQGKPPASTEPSAAPGGARVQMHVDAASLSDLPPHLVSEIELRIKPEMMPPQYLEEETTDSSE